MSQLIPNNIRSLKRVLISILIVFICSPVFSQVIVEKSSEIITENGKEYYLHEVLKGHTLFAISKAYDISITEIAEENPFVSNGLKAGQILRIRNYSADVVVPDNKNYFKHTVASNETMYSISHKYNVSIENIKDANPELDVNMLQVGQTLNIPIEKKLGESLVVLAREKDTVVVHFVKKDETLYGISKQYEVTIDSLISWNPSLKDEALKKGQSLQIRYRIKTSQQVIKVNTTQYDTILHQIKDKETLWSLAKRYKVTVDEIIELNPELKDGLKKDYYIYVPVPKIASEASTHSAAKGCEFSRYKNRYKVALMMPLYLDDIDRIWVDPSSDKTSKPFFKPFSFIEFYEGVMIAIDSLKNLGLAVDLYVYDTENDSATVKKLLQKPEMPYMDLIIGPFFSSNFVIAAKYAANHNIKIVSPFARSTVLLNQNPNLFQISPTSEARIRELADYISNTYENPSIILVMGKNKDDALVSAIFKEKIEMITELSSREIQLFEVKYFEGGYTGVAKMLDANKVNIVINLVTGEAVVSNYVNNMTKMLKTFDIVMFAHPEWRDYRTFDLQYLMELKTHMFTTTFVDYNDPDIKWFISEFRRKYNTEPADNNYAYFGYDISFFFLMALHEFGLDFESCLDKMEYDLLCTKFKFERHRDKGFENVFVNIYEYIDYELVLKNR